MGKIQKAGSAIPPNERTGSTTSTVSSSGELRPMDEEELRNAKSLEELLQEDVFGKGALA